MLTDSPTVEAAARTGADTDVARNPRDGVGSRPGRGAAGCGGPRPVLSCWHLSWPGRSSPCSLPAGDPVVPARSGGAAPAPRPWGPT